MSGTGIYTTILYILLIASGLTMLIIEGTDLVWVRLLIFVCCIFLVLLNDFLLKEHHIYNMLITAGQITLILLLVFISTGYAGMTLAVITQTGIIERYKRGASIFLSSLMYLLLIITIMISPYHEIVTFTTVFYILLIAFCAMLMLFSTKNTMLLQKENMERINELQIGKKKLQDLNKKIEIYGIQMEKMTLLKERSRVSKQIHDTLGHVLTAISVQLKAAELLIGRDSDKALEKIKNAKSQTDVGLESIKKVLELIDEDSMQFEDRLCEIVREAESGMNVKILSKITVKREISITLQNFIISAFKEGITNSVKHGKAYAFVFMLTIDAEGLMFHMEDNGRGCKRINMGYGLTAMMKQVRDFNGDMKVHSVEDEGFVIDIEIPKGGSLYDKDIVS